MPDWNRKKKIADIREALEKATPRWHHNGNEIVSLDNPHVGIGGFVREADNHLAANAPEWLRFLLSELERKDDVIEEQKTELFRSSKEIMELRKKSWQDQQWLEQASANAVEMQKELDREREENRKLREEREKLIEGLRYFMKEFGKVPVRPATAGAGHAYKKMLAILREIGVTV